MTQHQCHNCDNETTNEPVATCDACDAARRLGMHTLMRRAEFLEDIALRAWKWARPNQKPTGPEWREFALLMGLPDPETAITQRYIP